MKRFISFLFGVVMLFSCAALYAGDFSSDFAPIANSSINNIQLNMVTVGLLLRVAGELYSSIRGGGGLRRILTNFWFGENIPKVIAQDYKQELDTKQPPSPTPVPPAAPAL
jgi:hypothetical protein